MSVEKEWLANRRRAHVKREKFQSHLAVWFGSKNDLPDIRGRRAQFEGHNRGC
jgi:hypothetical protein